MAKRKTLLKNIEVQIAERKRRCRNTHVEIARGELCIVVFDGPRKRFNYSQSVGLKMISDAKARLDQYEQQLTNSE